MLLGDPGGRWTSFVRRFDSLEDPLDSFLSREKRRYRLAHLHQQRRLRPPGADQQHLLNARVRRRNRSFRRRRIVFLRRAEHLHVILSTSILPQILVLWVWREKIAATILLRGAILRDFEDRLLRVDGLGIAQDDRLVEILVVDGVL